MTRPATTTDRAAETGPAAPAEAVRAAVGEKAWASWFAGKSDFTVAGVEFTVRVGSPFALTYLQRKFSKPLRAAAKAVCGTAAELAFAVDGALLDEALERSEAGAGAVLPLKRDPAAVPAKAEPAPTFTPGRPRRLRQFGQFVAGAETELALTAAARFAAGRVPCLYLYGGSGLGKTHLLEGAVAAMRRRAGGGRVLLMTAEAFGNLFTEALRGRTLPAFRQKLRAADGLCVDDVDFLDGKAGFQEEFLHTLQEYERLGRPVACSADRHPRLLTKTPDELITRLSAGHVCRLAPPDAATRLQILSRKCEGRDLPVTADALKWVAGRFRASVRELEGALCCLETWREMTGKPVTLPAARKVLCDLERDCAARIRLADVERAVCDAAGVTAEAILRRKCEGRDLPVTADALKWVAGRFRASVRELEGALCCLETWREMTGKPVTLPAARKVLATTS